MNATVKAAAFAANFILSLIRLLQFKFANYTLARINTIVNRIVRGLESKALFFYVPISNTARS